MRPIALDVSRTSYEFRCPVHGFIEVSDWERSVIDHPAFQRLRRIRQLGWTDYVYPGGTHTRFEHSLGVMHVATRMYDAISKRSETLLQSRLAYDDVGRKRDRQLIRFAALLHDVGHGPFSHASEELLPVRPATNKKYSHEQYSAEIVRHRLQRAIEEHPSNENMSLSADDIASMIDGTSLNRRVLFWRELIEGQMDADRMDYLLRDSLHLGVQYGRFDLDRIVATAIAVEMRREDPEGSDCRLAVEEGGWHAAVGLILARYFMFTQVYFHRTRVAFDIHLKNALANMLQGSVFPMPVGDGIDEFLQWDDWRVLGRIAEGNGGDHGVRLHDRNHYRRIWESSESPLVDAREHLESLRTALGELLVDEASAANSWYKTGDPDILVANEDNDEVRPLSDYSSVIQQLREAPHRQMRFYSLPEKAIEEDGLYEKPWEEPMNDDIWARVALVTSLVWNSPQQTLGRTALMKLLFLLTSVRDVLVGYRFRMYTYGPFDAEVLADIDYAARLEGVSVDMEKYPNGYGYIIRPGAAAERIMEHGRQLLDEHDTDIEWVVEKYASLSASALERISTIVYLDREGLVESFGELALAVKGIKPQFDLATIEEDARRLQDAGLLVSCD